MDPKDGENRSPLADLPLFPDEPPRRRPGAREGRERPAAAAPAEAPQPPGQGEGPSGRGAGERSRAADEREQTAGGDAFPRDPEAPGSGTRSGTGALDDAGSLDEADPLGDLDEVDFLGEAADESGGRPGTARDAESARRAAGAVPPGAPPVPEPGRGTAGGGEPPARPSRRRGRGPELPLFPGAGAEAKAGERRPARPRGEPAADRWPLGPDLDPQPSLVLDSPSAAAEDAEPPPDAPEPTPAADPRRLPAPLGARLGAGALDLALLLAAAGLAVIGTWLLGVPLGLAGLPALAAFAAVFSFAYAVVPLAFWGRSPGMAVVGITARSRDGGPLTFGQVGLRWLGAALTLAFAGLPLLLALRPLGGRSLTDRLSGSWTTAA